MEKWHLHSNSFIFFSLIVSLVTPAQLAYGADYGTSSVTVSVKLPGIMVVKMPNEIKVENYRPDLENRETGSLIVLANNPEWALDFDSLSGIQVDQYSDTSESTTSEGSKVEMVSNESVAPNGKLECQNSNFKKVVIIRQGSRSDIISTDYETTVQLILSLDV